MGFALMALPLLSLTVEAISDRSIAEVAEQRQTSALAVPTRAEPPAPTPTADTDNWNVQTVGKGDTLAAVFQRLDLGPRTVHEVVHLDDNTARLTRIYPGDQLAFQLDAGGRLKALEYQLSEDERLRVSRVNDKLVSELQRESLLTQLHHTGGIISDSLFLAGREAGLSDRLIMEMAGLFGWDVDFVLDIRSGDEFHLIYEEVYRNGEFLRAGEIVAATFVNQGDKFQAVRFNTENGTEYFSPDGRNMRKAFLRAPLNFSYISSNFNPRRFHPIQKRIKPHNGTDYRAPSGTPVFSAGHGKVTASAYDKYNGHYVFVQHGNNIVTKYLHFTKRNVKKGQRVKQGEVIGYVGSTGMSQAPHLHYEFLVNGVHRNPRTVDLPKADPLPERQLAAFQQVSAPLLNQLELIQGKALLALKD
ncbi:MAG: OapA family protein [Lysobacterales bacterium]